MVMPESGKVLTFIDTPGHEAFSSMRANGAAVTDIVVLVVDAVEGVMPQTRESIVHANSAGCPIVVALSKCDRAGAEPERVSRQLVEAGLLLEGYGGDVQVVQTSATTGLGLGDLEEALLLQVGLDVGGKFNGRTRESQKLPLHTMWQSMFGAGV